MGRSNKVYLGTPFATVPVNVYDIITKEIVFAGSQNDAAVFIGTCSSRISMALKLKSKIKKRYVVRIRSDKDNVA